MGGDGLIAPDCYWQHDGIIQTGPKFQSKRCDQLQLVCAASVGAFSRSMLDFRTLASRGQRYNLQHGVWLIAWIVNGSLADILTPFRFPVAAMRRTAATACYFELGSLVLCGFTSTLDKVRVKRLAPRPGCQWRHDMVPHDGTHFQSQRSDDQLLYFPASVELYLAHWLCRHNSQGAK